MDIDVGILHIVMAMIAIYIPFFIRASDLGNRLKIILGSIYITQAVITLSCTSLLAFYINLELMILSASALIFGDGSGMRTKVALNYFLMHLVAGTTILCGYVLLGNFELIEASGNVGHLLMNGTISEQVGAGMILLGSMILIAAPPFSNWFVASYSYVSPITMCILICCTTKVVSVFIFHLFAGLHWLLFIGLLMVVINLLQMSRERKLRVVWIYGALSQLGINLIMISDAHESAKDVFYLHITIQILYQALLANIVTILEEHGVMYLDDLRGYKLAKFNILSVGYVFAILNILGMPWMVTHSTKAILQGALVYDLSPFLYLVTLFLSGYAVPVRSLAFNCKYNYAQFISISFLVAVLAIESVYYSEFWRLFTLDGAKYIAIVMLGAAMRYKYRLPYVEYYYKGVHRINVEHGTSPIFQYFNDKWQIVIAKLRQIILVINHRFTIEYTLIMAIALLVLSFFYIIPAQANINDKQVNMSQKISPRKSDYSYDFHGLTIKDEYQWMRDSKWPVVETKEILDYLTLENKHTASFFDPIANERDEIFEELKGKIKLADSSVPVKRDDYFYYTRTIANGQYPIYCRKSGSLKADEEIVLDVNKLAEGKKFTNVGAFSIAPDHKLAAFLVDFAGDERFSINVFDIKTGEYLKDEIKDAGSIVWHEKHPGFYYGKYDENWRQNKIYFHKLGESQEQDQLIYHEKDNLFSVDIYKASSKEYFLMKVRGHDSSETYYASIDGKIDQFQLIKAKQDGVRYSVDHREDSFYILTNDQGPNFRLAKSSVANPGKWLDYIKYENDAYLTGFDLTQNYLLLNYRIKGLNKPIVQTYDAKQINKLTFQDAAYEASVYSSNFKEDDIRISYSSLARTNSTYLYNFKQDTLKLLKQQEIPSGFNPEEYQVERVWADNDGVQVPITLVYKKSLFKKDGSNPLYLYGYGSYGYGMPAAYRNTAISYADRGIIFAIAHIRGGNDLGFDWYTAAKFLNKKHTFNDFIKCAEYLIENKYTTKGNIAIAGGSAGGMLMGNVINSRPELFGAAIAHVPFVDVINTMLDETLPLTPGEFKEWGNPKDKEYGEYMLSYSPYENIKAQEYPPIYATAGLTDPRVGYWEAAKWVARLRDKKTDNNILMLKTNMDAGHQGASGRFDYLKEVADDILFVSKMLKNVQPKT